VGHQRAGVLGAGGSLPGARGDGQPITTLIDLEAGTQPQYYFAGAGSTTLLLSGSGGYGFVAQVDNMVARNRGGKAFITLPEGETLCAPSLVSEATHVCCASTGGRILTFELAELKAMPNGGRGLMLISLEDKDTVGRGRGLCTQRAHRRHWPWRQGA
jgi:topoisomerase-4 subunit A